MLTKKNFHKTTGKQFLSADKSVIMGNGLIFLVLLFLFLFSSGSILKAQNPEWMNFANGNITISMVVEGNYLWIGTDGGLIKLNILTNEKVFFNKTNSGLPDNSVHCFAVDESGNIWSGGQNGLVKYDGVNWTVYDTSNSGLPNDYVNCLAVDSSRNIWVGTGNMTELAGGGGLAKYDGANWTVYDTSNSGLPSNDVWCLDIDESGNKWMGTGSRFDYCGLAKFDGTNWTVYNTSNSALPNDNVNCLAVDRSRNIWIGTGNIMEISGGLAKFDGKNGTIYNTSNSAFPHFRGMSVSCIVADRNNNIWIGILGDYVELVKYDGTNWTVYNTSNSGFPDNFVGPLAVDGSGNIWIGTEDGLVVFNEGGIVSVKELENKNEHYPDKFILSQNYPNPFNPSTTIKYSIPKQSYVTLKIYDILGREVAALVNEEKPAGNYEVAFNKQKTTNCKQLASGIYFYQIKAGDYVSTKKMTLLK